MRFENKSNKCKSLESSKHGGSAHKKPHLKVEGSTLNPQGQQLVFMTTSVPGVMQFESCDRKPQHIDPKTLYWQVIDKTTLHC